jgi:hypothetical protein
MLSVFLDCPFLIAPMAFSNIYLWTVQGSPHLQKIGRLDFSLREHEGEVKAWQGDFQQINRDMFLQKCIVSSHQFLLFFHLKCDFTNILLISFTFNFKFMLCNCIISIDLIFVDFRFYSFRLEICKDTYNIQMFVKIHITSRCLFPSLISINSKPCLKLDKLIAFLI